jgi:hypothetical protein
VTIAGPRLYQQPFPTGDYTFLQLGFLVDDVVAASRRWVDAHGVGPFFVLPDTGPVRVTHRGVDTTVHYRTSVSQAGPLQIELIQLLSDGANVYRDVFGEGRTGLHQVCSMTRDYDASIAHYTRLGYEVMAEQQAAGLGRVGYVDTVADFGFVTELVEWSDAFLRSLSKTARACAGWDGSDPIRILRPTGGYDIP